MICCGKCGEKAMYGHECKVSSASECTRSHPHENMSEACEKLTAAARTASLKNTLRHTQDECFESRAYIQKLTAENKALRTAHCGNCKWAAELLLDTCLNPDDQCGENDRTMWEPEETPCG